MISNRVVRCLLSVFLLYFIVHVVLVFAFAGASAATSCSGDSGDVGHGDPKP